MQKYYIIAISSLLILLTLGACKREVIEVTNTDTNYFPMETGKYLVYEVEYVIYNDFDRTVDTSFYFLKEEIGGTETDNLGDEYYRINRYIKGDSANAVWQFQEVWAQQVNKQFAYRIEDNQRYIAVVFPATLERRWDGLVYLRRDTTFSIPGGSIDVFKDWDDFQITGLHETETIGGITYDSVLTVLRADKINNIERRYSQEKYAYNIGLISRKDSILDTQCNGDIASCINDPWAEKAEKGYIIRKTLVETNWR